MIYNPKIVLAFWRDCGLPTPAIEYRFCASRKWRFDFAFLEWGLASGVSGLGSGVSGLGSGVSGLGSGKPRGPRRQTPSPTAFGGLAVEVQGGIWTRGRHARGSGLVKEHEKLNAAAALGWRVLYCTPQQVGTLKFARTIQQALATDGHR
jgi:hypothetical protein